MSSSSDVPVAEERNAVRGLNSGGTVLLLFLLAMLVAIVVRRAWIADDAFISLRTVDNFVNGYGLTWNPDERVQAYTHPLWLFLLSAAYFITREPYYTTLAVSLAVSLASVLVFSFWVARSWQGAALGLLIFALSGAFTDYSTSGLENPLSHLLVLLFLALYFRGTPSLRKLFGLSLVASLAAVNRLDTFLLYLPLLAFSTAELLVRTTRRRPQPIKALAALAAGQLPLLLWLAFSLFYYGFPFPNTAYAKLNSALAPGELMQQGLFYLANSLEYDPITAVAILLGIASALLSKRWAKIMVALGIALYVCYVVRIGGDFMSGRMLTVPLVAAVALLAQLDLAPLRSLSLAVLFGVVLVVGLSVPFPTPANDALSLMTEGQRDYIMGMPRGIANERLFYQEETALLSAKAHTSMPGHPWAEHGKELRATEQLLSVERAIGMTGYFAGPTVHVVDSLALADPLLARLPPKREVNWRIGHFDRAIPEGYRDTLLEGKNVLSDPDLALYYDKLALLTRGPLFDSKRLREIWAMNTGRYDGLINFERYRYADMKVKTLAELATFRPQGQPWDAPESLQFGSGGIEINVATEGGTHAAELEISLNSDNNRYQILYFLGERTVATQEVRESFPPKSGLDLHILAVPAEAVASGYDRIRILPLKTDGSASLGHVLLWEAGQQWLRCRSTGSAAPGEIAERGASAAEAPYCTIYFNDPRTAELLGFGWSQQEQWGVWNYGNQSQMVVDLDGGRAYTLEVEARPFETRDGCDQALRVTVNGVDLGEQSFWGCDLQKLKFEVPADSVVDGENALRFDYKATYVPRDDGKNPSADPRPLAVAFVAMTLAGR